MPVSKDEALRMAERLEFNSMNHLNWGWSVDHRDAAKMIRKLAGLPEAREPGLVKKMAQAVARRRK